MMTIRRHRFRAATRDPEPAAEPNRRRKSPERIEADRRRVKRVCLTTGLGCALIGGAFALTGSHTLHEMAIFLFGWSVGCAAAYLNILLQTRLVKRARRTDNS